MAVAGMDALSYPCENILTRRANQCTIPSSRNCKTPMALPDNGSSSAIAGKKSLPTIEVASARHSEGFASRVAEPRALSDARARGDIDVNTVPDLDKATALERDGPFFESSSRSIFLFEHDPGKRFAFVPGEKPVPTPHQVRGRLFPDHALSSDL